MQVAVETTQGLERVMTITFPVDEMKQDIQKRLKKLASTTRLNGFRPGKIPYQVIQQRFGKQVREEVLNEKIQKTFADALQQEQLHPAGSPEINNIDESQADSITYKAEFEVYPDVTITLPEEFHIEQPVVSINESDVDKTIENIRQQFQHFHTTDAAAEQNDKVVIDFTGTIEGEPFEGNSAQDFEVIIGAKRMIAGFEEGLLGCQSGDHKTLELTFPDDYHVNSLAGKPVVFEIDVKTVQNAHLPELNEDFFQKFGIKEGGLEAFREEVKKNMQNELENMIAERKKDAVVNILLRHHSIEIPKALIEEEARALAKKMREKYQLNTDNEQSNIELFKKEAERRVKLGLIMSQVVMENQITVNDEDVNKKVAKIAQSYENPEEIKNYYLSNKNAWREVHSVVLEEAIVDWVYNQATPEEKTYSFSEFMNTKTESQEAAEEAKSDE